MRYTSEVLALGVCLAVAGWYGRAPLEPYRRAAYLCAPLGSAAQFAGRLQAALSDHDQVVPAIDAHLPQLALDCERLVLRLNAPEEIER